ncbi:hypothetical protein Tco_0676438, partial [Tanacetum coccineum]
VDLEKPLVKNGDADNVDVHLYRSMIGSLMYLTASRPDIMFAVCACARFQVTPKTSHLLAVKRIFRYLKGKPTLGLWYSRDSSFELIAYFDSDYAGATQDRKSTTRDLLAKGFDAGRFQYLVSNFNTAESMAATTASSLEAEHDSGNIKTTTTRTNANGEVELTATIDGQEKTLTEASLRRHLNVHLLERAEGSMQQNELTNLVTKLTDRVAVLENDLQQTKKLYSSAFTKLILRVKKLKKQVKTTKARRRAKIMKNDMVSGGYRDSRRCRGSGEESDDTKILLEEQEPTKLVEDFGSREKGEKEVSTADVPVSTARPFSEVSTAAGRIMYSRKSAEKSKDKGKAIVQEDESILKKIKKQLEKERLGHEEAIRLQEQINEEERQRIVRDEEIARQLQEHIDIAKQEKVVDEAKESHDIDWSDPAMIRYHSPQNRPRSVAKVRKNLFKDQAGYKMSYFKGMIYEEIRPLFERPWDQNHTFVPKDSKIEKEVMKRPRFDLQQESTQKKEEIEIEQDVEESAKKQNLEEDNEKEELQLYLNIVSEDEGLDVESLATKYPMVDWETRIIGNKYYYQIKRADGSVKHYNLFSAMLYDFDRQDVLELYRLVKERFQTASPEGYDLLLWGDLMTMLEPNDEDEIWRDQQD